MAEQRFKNQVWALGNRTGRIASWDKVAIAVLMDIRDELQEIKQTLQSRKARSPKTGNRRKSAR